MIIHWRTTLESLTWTWHFVTRHLVLVLGLGLIAAGSRVIAQLWPETAPGALLEVVVWLSRLLLIVGAVRIGILADPGFRLNEINNRIDHFVHDRWPSLVIDGALLLVAFVVFSVPEWAASGLSGAQEDRYWALLLAIKNLTVIPLTFLWIVSIARQAVLYEKPVHQS